MYLLEVAEGHSDQARVVARFLAELCNGHDFPFDMTGGTVPMTPSTCPSRGREDSVVSELFSIRPLRGDQDFALVRGLYLRADDYVMMESGLAISDVLVADFFSCCPPSRDLSRSVKLGLFRHQDLLAIADLVFSYPNEDDAYLGLMLVARESRGLGIGHRFIV
ncbi:DUF7673 family protein, partial [Cupriavidus necator]